MRLPRWYSKPERINAFSRHNAIFQAMRFQNGTYNGKPNARTFPPPRLMLHPVVAFPNKLVLPLWELVRQDLTRTR